MAHVPQLVAAREQTDNELEHTIIVRKSLIPTHILHGVPSQMSPLPTTAFWTKANNREELDQLTTKQHGHFGYDGTYGLANDDMVQWVLQINMLTACDTLRVMMGAHVQAAALPLPQRCSEE